MTLTDVLKQINKKYGDNIARIGAEGLEVDGVLSLGSPMADYCLYGGIPEGRIVEFSGEAGSGKTSTAFLVCASYQREEIKRNPDNPRAIVFLDNEGTFDPTWASVFGYDSTQDAKVPTIMLRPEGQSAEQIFDMALDFLKTGEVGLLVFDSIATLVPAQIAEESMEKYQMGGIAKSLTRFANTAIGILRKYKATLIGINQVRNSMSMYSSPITTPGGLAWRHACSSRLMFKRGDLFDADGNKVPNTYQNPAGHYVMISVLKTKTSKWDRKGGSYRLDYNKGIDILSDTIECATHLGFIISPASGTFKLINPTTGEIILDENGEEVKIRGKNNIPKYFEEHMDLYHTLYDAVYEKLKQKEDPHIKSFEAMLNANTLNAFGFDASTFTDQDAPITVNIPKDVAIETLYDISSSPINMNKILNYDE